jgi:hypothetical protein
MLPVIASPAQSSINVQHNLICLLIVHAAWFWILQIGPENSRNLRCLSWSQYSSPHSNVHWLWLQANQRLTSEHTHTGNQYLPVLHANSLFLNLWQIQRQTNATDQNGGCVNQCCLENAGALTPSDLWSLKQKLDSSGQFRAGCINQHQHCLGKKI